MADGTRLFGSLGYRARFEWFNFDNDRYIDAYSQTAVLWSNETHVYNSSNCVLESYEGFGYQSIDFNNDGRPDIKLGSRHWENGRYYYNTKPEEVFVYAHGQWWPTRVSLLSMEEYRGEQEKMVLHSEAGLGSCMSIVGGSSTAMANSSTQAIDPNSDGYTDFVDAASGLFYQNLGDGRYVLNELGGQLTFRDFNNDGMTDYVLFDSEKKIHPYSCPKRTARGKSVLSFPIYTVTRKFTATILTRTGMWIY